MDMKKISERIFYVGVNDSSKTLFEGLWPLPYGVSYNSYIVADEKVALVDTVEHGFESEFIANIDEARLSCGQSYGAGSLVSCASDVGEISSDDDCGKCKDRPYVEGILWHSC